jgi:lysophospholipase L1-like esterase
LKNIIYKAVSAASISVLFFSCKPNVDVPAISKGNLNLSKYVALGNSITAGYADNALYFKAQQAAYPNLIAQQFRLAGGGEFKTPFVNAASVGVGAGLNARMVLAPVTGCAGAVSLAPVPLSSEGDMGIFMNSVAAGGPFQNMGIPGAKSTALIYGGYGNPANGQGNYNPFFTRMSANPQTASILSEAVAQQPSFFSLAIGNDDVLSYAIAGGAADVVTPASGAPGAGFDGTLEYIVTGLTANGAKGVVATVPHISLLPYFTTIAYNALALDAANAAGLTAAYSQLGITFHEGYNAFVIEDANAPGGMRQIQQGEYVLLSTPMDSLSCKGWGSMKPIPHQFVLTANEVTTITEAVNAYNVAIKSMADAKGLAFVDMNAFLATVKSGIIYNGVSINTQYVSGGTFSLDGLHFTPLGNALVANQFIKAINQKYGSTIPQVNVTNYKGISFP